MNGDTVNLLQFALALAGTLALIFGLAHLLKKIGLSQKMLKPKGQRLEVLESLMLDPQRRIVLLRQDAQAHLLLLGPARDSVIAQGLPLTAAFSPSFPLQASPLQAPPHQVETTSEEKPA